MVEIKNRDQEKKRNKKRGKEKGCKLLEKRGKRPKNVREANK